MDKNQFLRILADWNFWETELDTGIERPGYLSRFESLLKTNQVTVVTGARRSGKSYLMRQMVRRLINSGTDKKRTLFINFEDPRLPQLDARLLQDIYETYVEYLNPQGKPYIFLDEIQEVAGWEKWVRTMHELQKAQIVVSGSNAHLLSREMSGLLTGRHLDLTVFPLSFEEFLSFREKRPKTSFSFTEEGVATRRLFREYLEFGGFPEVAVRPERRSEILLTYLSDILKRDIVQRYQIRKKEALNGLARYYFSNIGHPVTFNSLEKTLTISADTVEKFSSYLETAYLFFFLKRFSWKVKEQEKSARKVYTIDNGLMSTAGFKFSQNTGFAMENLVFLQLRREQAVNPSLEVYHWKDSKGWEVDFVLKENGKVTTLIQVCQRLDNIQTKKRELRSLEKAKKELGAEKSVILTEDYEGAEKSASGGEVWFVPLWKWLVRPKGDVKSVSKT